MWLTTLLRHLHWDTSWSLSIPCHLCFSCNEILATASPLLKGHRHYSYPHTILRFVTCGKGHDEANINIRTVRGINLQKKNTFSKILLRFVTCGKGYNEANINIRTERGINLQKKYVFYNFKSLQHWDYLLCTLIGNWPLYKCGHITISERESLDFWPHRPKNDSSCAHPRAHFCSVEQANNDFPTNLSLISVQ